MKIIANKIQIEVEDTGPGLNAQGQQRPAVLLIMGLGMQLIAWPPGLVQGLVDAGYRVIRHDNRDIGLSQHFDAAGSPNLIWAILKYRLRCAVKSPYSVADMAMDALGVLDALNIKQAHIVGVSMGGMISQRVALAAPDRVLSLTSIMSSSGARGLPEARPEVLRAMMSRPASTSLEDIGDFYVNLIRVIGSPVFRVPEAEVRERIKVSTQRSYHPVGTLRQMLAIVADTTRAGELHRVTRPTLVMHGRADPLVPFACGEDTAKRIPNSKFVAIDGMAHDLPPGVVERLLPPMLAHFRASTTGV